MITDAKLAIWSPDDIIDREIIGRSLVGYIYDDSKYRFEDGQTVFTSKIVEVDKENMIIKTLNTCYKIVDAQEYNDQSL